MLGYIGLIVCNGNCFWNYVLRYEKLIGNMRIVENLKKIMFLLWCEVSA